MDLQFELYRTNPDYVVFNPETLDQSSKKTGNEHFLVEKLANGNLIAVWTQSSFEGRPDQHIEFSRSFDGGKTWLAPKTIAGPDPARNLGMASWAFPLVSRQGRIYVLFSRHMGVNDIGTHVTGELQCICSDDEGESWSLPVFLPRPRSKWDNADSAMPGNCIVWQKPLRLSRGKHYVGQTRWVTPKLSEENGLESVSEFLRFENVDDNPLPTDLQITWLMQNERSLRMGKSLEEPSIVPLPDGRLFSVMRSREKCAFYSISADQGETWSAPEPLLRHDGGPVLPHPHSPCPIYQLSESNYVFFYHNHDGHFLHYKPSALDKVRRPVCVVRGEFRPDARQPVWFSEPWYFMDSAGVPLLKRGLSLYASTTPIEGGVILWYPDRKFFLLGRRLTMPMFENMVLHDNEPPDVKKPV